MKIAIIGGTGMGSMLQERARLISKISVPRTPYGGPVVYQIFDFKGQEIFFVDRHNSSGKFCLPHQLVEQKLAQQYMYFLTQIKKVDIILATTAVGGIRERIYRIKPGMVHFPVDFIDYTGLAFSFAMQNFSNPLAFHRSARALICPWLFKFFVNELPLPYRNRVLGVTLQGPRFETPAEVRKYKKDGVDFLGMTTAFPEAILAREASVHYALAACVTNVAPEGPKAVDPEEITRQMASAQEYILNRFEAVIERVSSENRDKPSKKCQCQARPSVFLQRNS